MFITTFHIFSRALITCLFASSAFAASKTIGVSVPLSGPAAAWGHSIQNAISWADEQFDSDHTVRFIFEDDAFSPKNTLTNVQKFLSQGVSGLIVFGSSTSLAVVDIVERAKIPMLSVATSDKVSQGHSYVMRLMLSVAEENSLINSEIARHGYSKIAVVTSIHDGMLALKEKFLQNHSPQVVHSRDFNPDERDFRSAISQIRSYNPDAIYIVLLPPQGALFARQARELGFTGDLFASSQIEDLNQISLAGSAFKDLWYTGVNPPEMASLFESYQKTFNERPTNFMAYGYDAAKLFIEASRNGDMNSFLHSVRDFSGTCGVYSATENNDYSIRATIKKF